MMGCPRWTHVGAATHGMLWRMRVSSAGRSARTRGALLVAFGVALVIGGGALFFALVERHAELARSALLVFFVGFAMFLEGTVEVISGQRWGEHPAGRRLLFIVLGTPAIVAATIGALVLLESMSRG